MSVEDIRIEIRSIWPRHGAEFGIDPHLRKIRWVFERSKYPAKTDECPEIDYAFDTIFVAYAEPITIQWTGKKDIFNIRLDSSGAIGLSCASSRASGYCRSPIRFRQYRS